MEIYDKIVGLAKNTLIVLAVAIIILIIILYYAPNFGIKPVIKPG